MLAKLTSKNQLTLPKQVITALGHPTHFEVAVEGDRLVLTRDTPRPPRQCAESSTNSA